MICPKCNKKMVKTNLRFTSFVGVYKYAYYCPYCEKKEEDNKNEKH